MRRQPKTRRRLKVKFRIRKDSPTVKVGDTIELVGETQAMGYWTNIATKKRYRLGIPAGSYTVVGVGDGVVTLQDPTNENRVTEVWLSDLHGPEPTSEEPKDSNTMTVTVEEFERIKQVLEAPPQIHSRLEKLLKEPSILERQKP